FRRSVVARRSPMRRSSALRLTARRSPAPFAGRTRRSTCARRCTDLLSMPVRLPACLLFSNFVPFLSRIELLRTLHPGWKSLDELERYLQTSVSYPIQDPRPDVCDRLTYNQPDICIQHGTAV